MSKPRTKKEAEVTKLIDRLGKGKALVFFTHERIKVKDMEQLRRLLHNENAELVVVKKSLLKRALDVRQVPFDVDSIAGTAGIAFSYGDEVSAARIIDQFRKEHETISIICGFLEQHIITADAVRELAQLPSRAVLLAMTARALQSPLAGFVNVLAETIRSFIRTLSGIQQIKDKIQ